MQKAYGDIGSASLIGTKLFEFGSNLLLAFVWQNTELKTRFMNLFMDAISTILNFSHINYPYALHSTLLYIVSCRAAMHFLQTHYLSLFKFLHFVDVITWPTLGKRQNLYRLTVKSLCDYHLSNCIYTTLLYSTLWLIGHLHRPLT